jgi:hypothetical protein
VSECDFKVICEQCLKHAHVEVIQDNVMLIECHGETRMVGPSMFRPFQTTVLWGHLHDFDLNVAEVIKEIESLQRLLAAAARVTK